MPSAPDNQGLARPSLPGSFQRDGQRLRPDYVRGLTSGASSPGDGFGSAVHVMSDVLCVNDGEAQGTTAERGVRWPFAF